MSATRLGRWELVRPLGRGGMGEVWLARDSGGEEVAVKRLFAPLEGDALLRFEREADALLRLRHPGVVAWRDAGCDDAGRPWIALELVRGGTLAELVAREGPLPAAPALVVALDLCRALAAVHAAGVLHRDLKPANVLLDEAGLPKITDFGLARPIARGKSLTETGTLLGSPGYMAPEQVTGEKGELGPATDVYGLGATLFHLLTGRAPFQCRTVMEGLEATLRQPPPALSSLRPGIPAALEAIVLRCLAKDPAERYANARALEVALAGCLTPRPARRSPLAAAFLALGLAGAGVALVARREPSLPPPRELLPEAGPVPSRITVDTEPSPLPPPPESIAELFELGVERKRQGDHAGAIEALTRVIELDPAYPQAHAQRSLARFARGELKEEVEDLDRAIELEPTATAFSNRSVARRMLGDRKGALEDADRALALEPRFAKAHFARGVASFELGDHAGAIRSCTDALEIDPGFAQAHFIRGNARQALGDTPGALDDWSRAIELEPNPPHSGAYQNRAQLRLKTDLPGAITDLTRVIEIGPERGEVRASRAWALLMQGKLVEALADYERAVELYPRGSTESQEVMKMVEDLRNELAQQGG